MEVQSETFMMSTDPEPLVGVSLDSVVQKATEVAVILQTCKISLENQPSPLNWGRATSFSWYSNQNSGAVSPTPQPSIEYQRPATSPTPSNNALLEQWHQLTSYIVSLEKEVQEYKYLIEECQQAPILNINGPSDVVQNAGHAQRNEEQGQHCGSHEGTVSKKHSLSTQQEYWDKLVEDDRMSRALLLVFCHLSTHELCAMSRVCRKWHTITKHPLLWRNVTFSETVLHPQVLSRVSQLCTSTQKLTLHGLMPPMTEHDEDLSSYISRTRGSLEGAVETILTNSNNSLVSVSLTECNLMITERMLWLISLHCRNLKSLSYCSDEFPPSAESLWSITNGCKSIQHLYLPPVLGSPNQGCFNDYTLRVIATGWPNLVSLTVGGKTITVEGLAEIAHGCPNLCFLEIIHGPDMDKNAVSLLCEDNGLSSLTSLILNFTPSTHVALGHMLAQCQKLQRLELHVTLQSYFTTDANNPESISAYEQIIRNLKKLERHRRGRNVFHLFEHYSRT